jgi:hypothetical protein
MISKTLEWSAIPLMDFKNEFENNMGDVYPGVGGKSFSEITLVITNCSLRAINTCNNDYPGMGWGLARSLFILVRESHNYIWVRGTPESGLLQGNGQ